MSSPSTVSINEIVLSVKLCVPLIHLDISDSFFPAAFAKSAWLHPFFSNNSTIRAVMENERLLWRLDSSGISSYISANNGFVYSVLFIFMRFEVSDYIFRNGCLFHRLPIRIRLYQFVVGLSLFLQVTDLLRKCVISFPRRCLI